MDIELEISTAFGKAKSTAAKTAYLGVGWTDKDAVAKKAECLEFETEKNLVEMLVDYEVADLENRKAEMKVPYLVEATGIE